MTISNMSHLLRTYLTAPSIAYVVLCYGLHGRRRNIYARVIESLRDLEYALVPITVTCDRRENIRRMQGDSRSEQRIARAIESRQAYRGLCWPKLDTTGMTPQEAVAEVLRIVGAVGSSASNDGLRPRETDDISRRKCR